ncbi:ABC transporter substrate-binding protein [Janibacter terrae]|uniref:ABC transporter substrate-binding protein n=1 Tax=Janibacter terrae TaxID=103817 RepID=UPI0031F7A485
MRTRHFWGTALVVGLALGASACGGESSAGATDGELEKTELTVGSLPLADYAALYWADEKGFFDKAGLDVTIETVQGGPAGVQQVVAGELDFTNSPAFVAATAHDSGLPIRSVVITSALAEDGMGIYVLDGSPIKDIGDLDGKSIGTNTTKNIGDITFRAQAKSEGASVTPKWVEVPFPEMLSGVKAKSVDAGYFPEPFASFARTAGLRKVVDLTTGPNDGLAAASYLSSETFVKDNPDTTKAFADAMYAAGADMAKKEDEVRSWLPTFAKLDKKTAESMPLPAYYGAYDEEGLQRALDILKEQELVKADLEVGDVHWAPAE